MATAGSLLGGSLVPGAEAATTDDTKIVRTNCRSCTADCGVLAHVKNGRVVKLDGDPDFPEAKALCASKGFPEFRHSITPTDLNIRSKESV
ncbi:MAG: hypothetical protein LRY50_16335 [Geovibrio sp.]|nr:hypothetical protein [Geovibrio sp.]